MKLLFFLFLVVFVSAQHPTTVFLNNPALRDHVNVEHKENLTTVSLNTIKFKRVVVNIGRKPNGNVGVNIRGPKGFFKLRKVGNTGHVLLKDVRGRKLDVRIRGNKNGPINVDVNHLKKNVKRPKSSCVKTNKKLAKLARKVRKLARKSHKLSKRARRVASKNVKKAKRLTKKARRYLKKAHDLRASVSASNLGCSSRKTTKLLSRVQKKVIKVSQHVKKSNVKVAKAQEKREKKQREQECATKVQRAVAKVFKKAGIKQNVIINKKCSTK